MLSLAFASMKRETDVERSQVGPLGHPKNAPWPSHSNRSKQATTYGNRNCDHSFAPRATITRMVNETSWTVCCQTHRSLICTLEIHLHPHHMSDLTGPSVSTTQLACIPLSFSDIVLKFSLVGLCSGVLLHQVLGDVFTLVMSVCAC